MKPGDSPSNEELREALAAALSVARDGKEAKPPIDPPARLKPILTFKKFSAQAWGQVREVVDSDDEFRDRVVAAVDEEAMSRVAWLWLSRPGGWEQEWAELAASARLESEHSADAQNHHALEQRLERAKGALKKAEGQRDRAARERDEARLQAAQGRTEARNSEVEYSKLLAELDLVREDRDTIRKSLERLDRKEVRTHDKLKKAHKQIDLLKKELRDSRAQYDEEVGSLKERLTVAEEEAAMARQAGFEPPRETEPDPPSPISRRIPALLPPGMLKDTVGAIEHLLRTPKVVMLVDGYNVTFKSWQEMPVRAQRERLLQKLEELSARFSEAEIVVVFDGTETDYDYISTTVRSLGVTVRFSPTGIEADDVIIKWCREYPLWQPLVVVSHDSRVRESARQLGANLVQPSKLLTLMGVAMETDHDPFGFLER